MKRRTVAPTDAPDTPSSFAPDALVHEPVGGWDAWTLHAAARAYTARHGLPPASAADLAATWAREHPDAVLAVPETDR